MNKMEKISKSKFSTFKNENFLDLRKIIGGYCTNNNNCVDTAQNTVASYVRDPRTGESTASYKEDITSMNCTRSGNDSLAAIYPGNALSLELKGCWNLIYPQIK